MSLENMSEEECSPSKFPRLTIPLLDLGVTTGINGLVEAHINGLQAEASGRSYAKQIIDQLPCNGKYFFSNPFKVTILANGWGWRWGSWEFNSILKKELSKQLAKFPHMKVTVLVPEGSCDEIDKRDAESHNVTIVEAKKKPGFQNPNDWLCFPPKGLTTDIVIGVGERLCKMTQIFKELHHCKSIFVGCDSFEENFSRDAELRDAQAKMEDECLGKSNVQPMMEMADLPVAVGPKRAEKLSVSLPMNFCSTRQDPVTWNQGECIAQLQEQKDQEVERLTERLQQTEQAVKQSHHEREVERESFRLGIERLAQRKTEEVKTLTLALEEEKCKRIKAEECSQHLSELQKQKDQEVERLTEAHLELNLRNKSFQQEIENLKKERQELFGALRKLFESQNILQQRIEKLVEESQGTSEQMRQTFQEVEQTKLELKAEYESLRLEKERWSDERMTDVEKILGQKLDEQIRERTKAEEISRYLLEENCQLNARVKELMSRQAELAEVSCSTPSPDTVQENLVESNNDLTIGEANEESD